MPQPNARVQLDLVRDAISNGTTIVDLAPYFQGRVGDSEAWLPVALTDDGVAADLSNYAIVAQGDDPKGRPFTFYGKARADRHRDDMKRGRFTFYFPAGSFQTPGVWDDFFIRVIDPNVNDVEKSNTIVSTLSCKLTALPEHVNMTITREAYDTNMESELDKFKAHLADTQAKLDQEAKELSTKYPNLTAEMQTLKALDNSVKQMISDKQVATIEDLGTNVLENDMGNLPTPAALIQDGFFKKHYGYCQLGDLGITEGKEISDTSLDDVCYIESIVLNSRVIQHAVITSADTVWEVDRRSTGDTTWSDWVIDTKFYH